jgi:predicted outer membrane repeat protein
VVIDRPMTLLGAGQATTFLDGGGAGTQLLIDAVSVTIEGFTFQNGEAEHDTLGGNNVCGGAVAIDHSFGPMEVNIKDCTFTANHGPNGGAICYDGGNNDDSQQRLFLDGVTIEGNSADNNGGGLFSYSSTTMTDTTIINNTAGNQGGGIYFSYSDNVVDGGAIKQNTADEGGGMFLQSPVTVDVNASDWGFGMAQENVPNDVEHYANEYGFFGDNVSFFCEYIEFNMGMCALD